VINDTVLDGVDLSKLAYHELVALGVDMRSERDKYTWEIGRLADAVCTPKPGRPANGSESKTITAFAADIMEDRSVISTLLSNWRFWPASVREKYPDLSWRRFSEARRRSGHRGLEPPTEVELRRALAFIQKWDSESPYLPDPRPAWQRRLARACDILATIAADPETPPLVALAVSTGLLALAGHPVDVRTLIGQVRPAE